MPSWVVADSNIFLATAMKEDFSTQARALVAAWHNSDVRIATPYLFRYELVSTIRKHVSRGTITLDDGRRTLNGLLQQPVETFTDETLLTRAFELATQINQTVAYDSVYLALAEQLGCEFWTSDLRFFNITSHAFDWVKWVGSFTPQT